MSLALDNIDRVPLVHLWGTGGIFSLSIGRDFFFGWEGPYSTGSAARWMMFFDQTIAPANGETPRWVWPIMGGPVTSLARIALDRTGWKPIQPLLNGWLILSSTAPTLTVIAAATIGAATTIVGRRPSV